MFFRFTVYYFAWALLIFLLSMLPGSAFPSVSLLEFDKMVHILFYGVLTFLGAVSFSKQYTFRILRFNPVKASFICGLAYGIFMEMNQGLVTGRKFDIYDIIANLIGCIFGVIVFKAVYFNLKTD